MTVHLTVHLTGLGVQSRRLEPGVEAGPGARAGEEEGGAVGDGGAEGQGEGPEGIRE